MSEMYKPKKENVIKLEKFLKEKQSNNKDKENGKRDIQ